MCGEGSLGLGLGFGWRLLGLRLLLARHKARLLGALVSCDRWAIPERLVGVLGAGLGAGSRLRWATRACRSRGVRVRWPRQALTRERSGRSCPSRFAWIPQRRHHLTGRDVSWTDRRRVVVHWCQAVGDDHPRLRHALVRVGAGASALPGSRGDHAGRHQCDVRARRNRRERGFLQLLVCALGRRRVHCASRGRVLTASSCARAIELPVARVARLVRRNVVWNQYAGGPPVRPVKAGDRTIHRRVFVGFRLRSGGHLWSHDARRLELVARRERVAG